jgi:hypothetical protein
VTAPTSSSLEREWQSAVNQACVREIARSLDAFQLGVRNVHIGWFTWAGEEFKAAASLVDVAPDPVVGRYVGRELKEMRNV